MDRLEVVARALLRSVDQASGPDRELDCYIWGAVEGWTVHELKSQVIVADKPGEVQRVLGWADPGKGLRNVSINRDEIPRYTASIDAALALVEKVLPGAFWLVGKGKTRAAEPPYGCQLLFGTDEIIGEGESSANAALSVLAALLRALQSQEPTND